MACVLNYGTATRIKQPPKFLQHYYSGTSSLFPYAKNSSPSIGCFSNKGNLYSISSFLSTDSLVSSHKAFLASISTFQEPKTYKQTAKLS